MAVFVDKKLVKKCFFFKLFLTLKKLEVLKFTAVIWIWGFAATTTQPWWVPWSQLHADITFSTAIRNIFPGSRIFRRRTLRRGTVRCKKTTKMNPTNLTETNIFFSQRTVPQRKIRAQFSQYSGIWPVFTQGQHCPTLLGMTSARREIEQNLIVLTIFRLIWTQTELGWISNYWEICHRDQISFKPPRNGNVVLCVQWLNGKFIPGCPRNFLT